MVKVDSGRLREPAAWIMLTVVATGVLLGAIRLLFGAGSFTGRAAVTLSSFVSPVSTALAVGAVLLVTRFGDPTPRARLVNLGTMATLGLATLLGLVSTLAGIFADGSMGDKLEYLVMALPMVALAAVGLVFARSSIGADVPRSKPGRADDRFFGFPDDNFAGYNPQQAQPVQAVPPVQPISAVQPVSPVQPVQPVQPAQAAGTPSFAPTQVEPAYVPGQAEPAYGQAEPAYGQAQSEQSFGSGQQEHGYGQSQQEQGYGQPQQEPAYGQPQPEPSFMSGQAEQPYAASPAEPYAPAQGFQEGYAPAPQPVNQGYPQQEQQPAGHFAPQGYAPESQGYASEPQGYAPEPQAAAVVPFGQQPAQLPSPAAQHPMQPTPQPVQPVQQPAPQAFPQSTGGYPQPPQGPMFDQHGYAGQQGDASGYGAFGSQQDNSPFPPAPQIEAVGYAQQGYADQGFGQAAYPAAEQAQPYAQQQETYGRPQAEPYGQQSQQSHQSHQSQQDSYGQQDYGQQGSSSFSGYSGAQFGHQAAEQAPSFEQPAQHQVQPAQGFDPSRPYEQAVDPREQQLAAAYQQAQSYQQHAQPVDYAGSQTAPQDYPDYYDNPLGHAQTPEPARYAAPSDQTMRFDANLYQGDPLSGPSRRQDTIDPTAIYAPERSQAKLEEGVSTEQAGHGADPQAPWYGSQR
ncbi:hypothetical protein IMZ11_32980 [Microtetraspora sp. AC03309]|uniref:hypothetical protein n=1 Tax=Microtetraspora sp. AC03309 TaxID=2779376 RepID=UPI001E3F4D80|nr:hypothetical protein [Microtetraspora sp. AC03309]MCC5580444.1 hypothetical protein [Microtetraspora sp. AC03309]